ncbi:hypothetical protein TIFTF001_030668, partial [Ficus carica]
MPSKIRRPHHKLRPRLLLPLIPLRPPQAPPPPPPRLLFYRKRPCSSRRFSRRPL